MATLTLTSLTLKDFISSDIFSFETYSNIWKNETKISIDFSNEEDKNQCLKNNLQLINEELSWTQKNKDRIEELLIENDCIELAENWASGAHLLECADEECYVMEDGQKVSFPITSDDFCNSLYIESITIIFNDCKKPPLLQLFVLCNPDYFSGHFFWIDIDENRNLIFSGLNG